MYSYPALDPQYCEYYPEYEKCKEWLERHMPDDFERLKIEEEAAAADGTDDDKKRQKRGGKGLLRVKKKEDVPKRICVSRAARGKKKSVTVVTGLSTFGGSYYQLTPFTCQSKEELPGDGTSPLWFYFYKSYILTHFSVKQSL